jgi:RNA polymerase sigma-70 factor (TIGR02957 family)
MTAADVSELRPVVFGIAYRMLGSVSEAEDAVQEAFLRLHRAAGAGQRIESRRAYLATVVTRLCIDHLRSARVRRERYVGEWLPEPLIGAEDADPARHAEMADSLSVAFLLLLERLSPEQRAAFLLREVFDYPYADVARIVDTSEANARQLVSRARKHVDEGRPRFEPSQELRDELAKRFLAAIEEGDLAGLEDMLADDVVLHGDGGGKVPALARPVMGRKRVARTLQAWAKAAKRLGGATMRPVVVNGQPGAMSFDADGGLINVLALEVVDGRVQAVSSVVNPDKLGHLRPLADYDALLKRRS